MEEVSTSACFSRRHCSVMLFLTLAVLLETTGASADFMDNTSAFTFIYHERLDLLLTMQGDSCYFTEVDHHLHTVLNDPARQAAVQSQIRQYIVHQESNVRATTLSAVRDEFRDMLADFHCQDKNIFSLHLDQTTAATTTSSPTSPTTSPSGCKPRTADCEDLADSSVCSMHGFCAGGYATVVCRKTCEICQNGCEDQLGWEACRQLYSGPQAVAGCKADLCNDPLGNQLCQRTCGCKGFCPA